MRILIVEDDETLADGLSVGLRLSGLTPELVTTVADARRRWRMVDILRSCSISCCRMVPG